MMPSLGTNLPVVLRARAAEMPDRIYAVDVDDRQLTYRQMAEWMDRWAAAWHRAEVEPGEYVVTMQYNTFEYLAGWLGLACLGAVETAINTDYRGDLLTHALNITRARTMLVTRQYLERVAEVASDLRYLKRVIVIDAEAPVADMPFEIVTGRDFLAGVEPMRVATDPEIWDIAGVLFTSGTTGPSKAVRMPWGQLYATAMSTLPFDDLVAEDVFFNAGPTYHLGAKVFPLITALVGGRHVMRPYVSESKLSFEYRKYGVTTCFYPPLMWLDEPPRPDDAKCALRNLLFPIPLPQMAEFKRRFGCRTFSVYSMTEMSCPIADRDWDIGHINERGLFSCGKLRSGFPGYEAKIVDEWDRPVPLGDVGELIVRASEPWGMNAGYLNNPRSHRFRLAQWLVSHRRRLQHRRRRLFLFPRSDEGLHPPEGRKCVELRSRGRREEAPRDRGLRSGRREADRGSNGGRGDPARRRAQTRIQLSPRTPLSARSFRASRNS